MFIFELLICLTLLLPRSFGENSTALPEPVNMKDGADESINESVFQKMDSNQIIVWARARIVEKKRKSALRALAKAYDREVSPARQKLIAKELDKMSTLFYTNEGQQIFETAESLRLTGKTSFLEKYEAALILEPDNHSVQMGYALGLLQLKNCQKALEIAPSLEWAHPRAMEVATVRFNAQVCVDPTKTQESDIRRAETSNNIFFKSINGYRLIKMGQPLEFAKMAKQMREIDDKYPTGLYLSWLSLKEDSEGAIDVGQQYLGICKDLNLELRRKYYLDPRMCENMTEVEEYLKQSEVKKK